MWIWKQDIITITQSNFCLLLASSVAFIICIKICWLQRVFISWEVMKTLDKRWVKLGTPIWVVLPLMSVVLTPMPVVLPRMSVGLPPLSIVLPPMSVWLLTMSVVLPPMSVVLPPMSVAQPPIGKVSGKVFTFMFDLCLYKKLSLQSQIQKIIQKSDFWRITQRNPILIV